MKRLSLSSLYSNIHFIAILIILLIFSIKYYYILPILLVYLFFIFKKTNLFKLAIIAIILVLFSYLQYRFIEINCDSIEGIVIRDDNNKYVLLTQKGKIMLYSEESLELGDVLSSNIEALDYDSSLFSYSDYLLNNNIIQKDIKTPITIKRIL